MPRTLSTEVDEKGNEKKVAEYYDYVEVLQKGQEHILDVKAMIDSVERC